MNQQALHAELTRFVDSTRARMRSTFLQHPAAGIDYRMALVELSRACDVVRLRPYLAQMPDESGMSSLYARGMPSAFGTFMDDCIDRLGVPLAVSDDRLQGWSHSCIQQFGRLSQLEYLLELVGEGYFDIIAVASNRFEFKPTCEIIDHEAFDVADQQWLRTRLVLNDSPWIGHLNQRSPEVFDRMKRLMSVWRDQLIIYDSDPVIDDYFLQAGTAWARSLGGQTELPSESTIGGLPFYAYLAAIGVMCGRALKHLSYATELYLLHPELDLHNLFTIWSSTQKWNEYFQIELGVDEETAHKLLSSLTLDQSYCQQFSDVPSAAPPPLVQVGRNQLMLSLTGCLDGPFWFVLRKLRFQFRRDWDSIMDSRDVAFRNDLRMVLDRESIRFGDRIARIRAAGRDLTDIDAVAFELTSGTLVLFQLKWQDPHGHSMRERRSRMKNLATTANAWIGDVQGWLKDNSPEPLLKVAGIEIDLARHPIRNIQLVVLARHQARFTGTHNVSNGAVWGSWPQLCRIVSEVRVGSDLLSQVVQKIGVEMARSVSPRPFGSGTIRIGETEFVVVD